MKFILVLLMTFLTLTFASPVSTVKTSSIIESLSQLLYTHLNPIFQSTLQQLTDLVFQLGDKLFQPNEYRSARSNLAVPAPWVSQLFGGMDAITTQWNNHITQFFTNIPTIFEKIGRNLFDFTMIKQKLHNAVGLLLEKLQRLFVNNINRLISSIVNEYNLMEFIGRKRQAVNLDVLLNIFQQQVSGVFDKAKEQLNRNVDDSIDFILSVWNDLKDHLIG